MTITNLKWNLIYFKFKPNKDLTRFKKGAKLVIIKHKIELKFYYDGIQVYQCYEKVDNHKFNSFLNFRNSSPFDFEHFCLTQKAIMEERD